ncbi:MAG: hypothetical protein HUU19_13355 [Phycisphaerales bacterium]|nr:hypothetical protein [Phycisphaerales bacterium]
MSVKWEQTKRWDREHLTGPLAPVRWVLHLFSSVWLGVWLLVFVALYAVLASVPIGLLAQAPTLLFDIATLLASIALVAGLPVWLIARATRAWPAPRRAARFVLLFFAALALAVLAALAWWSLVWPRIVYDPVTKSGVRFFADFIEANRATTLRRLPMLEMTELEFYAWWPLRVVLLAFVANMIVATVRRIEFCFKNLGVLMVHSGIVLIALGSVYYNRLKLEGDTLLLAGPPDESGNPTPGPAQDRFYDNTRLSLYVQDRGVWLARPLTGVPRYNDYALHKIGQPGDVSAWENSGRPVPWKVEPARDLDLPVPPQSSEFGPGVDLRIVGYANYAEPVTDYLKRAANESASAGQSSARADSSRPLRVVQLISALPDPQGRVTDDPAFVFTLSPAEPARRLSDAGSFAIEYTAGPTMGMTPERWRDLSEALPPDTSHALVVEIPASGFRAVYAVKQGDELSIADTGYRISVTELAERPPFPIITEGYRGAESSVAIVKVTPPAGSPFDRWVYHRFPEISQDMTSELNERGMPKRRDADPAIRISYLDARAVQVYFDDPEGVNAPPRAIVRLPGGSLRVVETLDPSGLLGEVVPKISLRVSERWAHGEAVERPSPVPTEQREKAMIGSHESAMLAVEVRAVAQGKDWRRVVWLPFTKYMGMGMGTERFVTLPDGREIGLAFGRRQNRLPGFAVELLDFEMIAREHRGPPKDFRSTLRVMPSGFGPDDFEAFVHTTSLNEPLQAPFLWEDSRGLVSNVLGTIRSRLDPTQFKFSQAGWDQQGWMETQALADQGLAKRPTAKFTILQVGNNPGIHVVALGSILMGVGIPWAFYIKPWLMRREKKRIQDQIARGEHPTQARTPRNAIQREIKPEPMAVSTEETNP